MFPSSWFDLARHDEPPATPAPPALPAPPAPTAPVVPPAPPAPDTGFPANTPVAEMTTEQQAAYWKHQSRKHEDTAKARGDYDDLKAKAAKLAEIEAANATEQEKAVKAARDQATAEARQGFGAKLAAAEIKAALTNVVPDPAAIVEDLNLTKYVKDDGEVDSDAVAALKAKYVALAPAVDTRKPPPKPDLGQGAGGDGGNTDFRKAEKVDVDAELRKLGIRPLR